jgi:hypothetical protein
VRAHRAGEKLEPGSAKPPRKPLPHVNHEFIAVVRRALEMADGVDTVDGQIALALAERVATDGISGLPALTRELQAVMRRALARGDGLDDEVARARRQRAEARRALGEEER